jgi:hypothetical protein
MHLRSTCCRFVIRALSLTAVLLTAGISYKLSRYSFHPTTSAAS